MPFGFFKKKNKDKGPHYDPTNIRVMDIRKGFIFDYDDKTWEAVEEYEYDWGNNDFTYEFKIEAPDETSYLYVEEDDEVECLILKKLPIQRLDDSVIAKIKKKGKPPKQIEFDGVVYYRDEENPGYFRNIDSKNWSEFISWSYYDDSDTKVLNIEQWGDDSFEASIGLSVPERAISNILPV